MLKAVCYKHITKPVVIRRDTSLSKDKNRETTKRAESTMIYGYNTSKSRPTVVRQVFHRCRTTARSELELRMFKFCASLLSMYTQEATHHTDFHPPSSTSNSHRPQLLVPGPSVEVRNACSFSLLRHDSASHAISPKRREIGDWQSTK